MKKKHVDAPKPPADTGPTSWYEDVTPTLAADYLKKNTHNRPLNRARVAEYAEAMRAGRWHVSHQGVAFDAAGNLIDGQHRLHAIVSSGCTIRMQVTMGLTREALLVIDTGRARTVAQNLSLMGKTHAKSVTAWSNVARAVIQGGEGRTFSAGEVERIYDELGATIDAAMSSFGTRINNGSVGGAFLLTYRKDPGKVVAFFEQFLKGEGLTHGSPVLAAHKYYFVSSAKSRDERWEIAVKLMRCIQGFICGETIDPAHVYVSEQAIAYFADAHPAETTFGQLYDARTPLAKGGAKEKG